MKTDGPEAIEQIVTQKYIENAIGEKSTLMKWREMHLHDAPLVRKFSRVILSNTDMER